MYKESSYATSSLLALALSLVLFRSFLFLPRSRAEESLDLRTALQVQPRADKDESKVEEYVSPEDAVVSPDVASVDVEGSRKGIAVSVLTETTPAIGLGDDIASGLLSVGSYIAIAGLTGWRWETGKFLLIAFDGEAVCDQCEQAFQQIPGWS